jgi:hypothetical protein
LVSKLTKVKERSIEVESGKRSRINNKDALDILRILRTADVKSLTVIMATLAEDSISATVTRQALIALGDLFGTPNSIGCKMAADAAMPLEDADTIRLSCSTLANRLLNAINL